MSLRFIPNTTKLSPYKMFAMAAEQKELEHYKKIQKKKQSVEYLMFLRRTLYCMFADDTLLGRYLEQFEVENKKIMDNIKKAQMAVLERYLNEGFFDRKRFEVDLNNLLNKFSNKYKEDNPTEVVLKIIENNEMLNNELKKPDVVANLELFDGKRKERALEMSFLTMYLASASDKEHDRIAKAVPNSELLATIKDQKAYQELRDAYRNSFIIENKDELQKKSNIKKRLAL